jgi:hypothetical protein
VRSYDELRRTVADWCRQISMSREELDAEAGLTSGHAGKLLSARASKKFGMVTLGRVMAAAGLVLIVAIDPDAPPRDAHASGNASDKSRANGSVTRHWRKRMAALRTLKQSAAERSASARKAAQARWQRPGGASHS